VRTRSFCSAVFLIVPALLIAGPKQQLPASPGPVYRPPVDAPVSDPFRQPIGPYGPGNRGLDYATVPGSPVIAIGAGVVVFAGTIANRLYVTVLHPDGLRSSYSYLDAIGVSLGQSIAAGQQIGTASGDVQLGVRRGDQYIDPASLFGRRRRPRLVRPPR
jgi:murein DD-endopeptidase MepM/ murein hydrolase activator NlpD